MTNAKKITTPKPANDRPEAPRRGRGSAPKAPSASGQTATREGESSHAAPAAAPSESTDRGDGSPAPSPASSARNLLVRFDLNAGPSAVAFAVTRAVLAMVAPVDLDAFTKLLLAIVKAGDVTAWAVAVDALDTSPFAEHGRAIIGALGGSPDHFHGRPEGFDKALFACVILARDEMRQHCNPALDAVLRDVARECEMGTNGELAVGVCGVQRIARGETLAHEREEGADMLPDALAWLAVDLRRDYRHACDRYREEYANVAGSRRNDPPDVLARHLANLRYARAALVRIAALAGRVAAAVTAAEPRATEAV